MLCASPFLPPLAICATREASGWNTAEPMPMQHTATRMLAKEAAQASCTSPTSVKHMPHANE